MAWTAKNSTDYKNNYKSEHYKNISLAIPFDLYDRVKSAAINENRSVTGYIKIALQEKLDNKKKAAE